jgi:hypothetical protein
MHALQLREEHLPADQGETPSIGTSQRPTDPEHVLHTSVRDASTVFPSRFSLTPPPQFGSLPIITRDLLPQH